MDETLGFVAVDLSGRPYAVVDVTWTASDVGGIPVTLFEHFFESFAVTARANVHARVLYGRDDHHKAEALFKALGRALDAATQLDPRRGTTCADRRRGVVMIALIDYGAGNVRSVHKALPAVGADVTVTQ